MGLGVFVSADVRVRGLVGVGGQDSLMQARSIYRQYVLLVEIMLSKSPRWRSTTSKSVSMFPCSSSHVANALSPSVSMHARKMWLELTTDSPTDQCNKKTPTQKIWWISYGAVGSVAHELYYEHNGEREREAQPIDDKIKLYYHQLLTHRQQALMQWRPFLLV